MNELAIVGASGHGKVVADLAELLGYSVFFFDDAYPSKKSLEHWPIKGTVTDLLRSKNKIPHAIVAIGDNLIRGKLSNKLQTQGFILPKLIHPKATVSQYATIKNGTVVFAHAVVNAFAKVGDFCIINTGAIVEHDCVLENGVHLSPNVSLAGATSIGEFTWVGIGSVSKQLINIGNNTVVGANSTIIKDIPSNVIAFGSPAVY